MNSTQQNGNKQTNTSKNYRGKKPKRNKAQVETIQDYQIPLPDDTDANLNKTLAAVDTKRCLSIWTFIDSANKDVLVSKYIRMISELEILPILNGELYEKHIQMEKVDLTYELKNKDITMTKVISNFMLAM